MRKSWLAVAFALALVLGGLAPGQRADAVATTTITVGDDYFCGPSYEGTTCPVTVTAGDTVVWRYSAGNSVHTSSGAAWDSGALHVGGTYSRTFSSPGVFSYRCDIHPNKMNGTVTVLEASQPSSPSQSSPSGQSGGSLGSGATPPPALSPGSVPTQGGGSASDLPEAGGEPPADFASPFSWLSIAVGAVLLAVGTLSLASSRRRVFR